MFSPRICKYSMSKLIIEVLKMVKEYKIYQNRGYREAQPLGIWPKYLPGGRDLAVYENLPSGMIALGTDWYKTLKYVKTVSRISENWMDGYGFTGGHILILMINCFQKAASARYVTFVWIYILHACQNWNGLQLQSLLCINIQKDYLVSKVAQEVLCTTPRTTHDQWTDLSDLW